MAENRTSRGRKRLLVTTSILLAFLSGVPIWRKTTEIYRSPIPFTTIKDHSERVLSHPLALPCHLQVIFVDSREDVESSHLQDWASSVREQIQESLGGHAPSHYCDTGSRLVVSIDSPSGCHRDGSFEEFSTWPCGLANANLENAVGASSDHEVDELLRDHAENSTSARGQEKGGKYTIVVVDGGDNAQSTAVIGKYRHAWISVLDPFSKTYEVVPLVAEVARVFFDNSKTGTQSSGIEKRMPLAADGRVVLSFSLLNANPDSWTFDWDFASVEKQFLEPVVAAMAPVALMTVESQVLYYTPKAVHSAWDPQLASYVITPEELPFFVNAKEWHLDSSTASVGRSKLLHFAIYVSAANECPLHIKNSNGQLLTNGFTSPGWGGVTIWNPPACHVEKENGRAVLQRLHPVVILHIMGIVLGQLRTLFGLPSLNFSTEARFRHTPAIATGLAEWEVDALLRRRIAADESAAAATLTSLSELVQSLPNMVIKDEISSQVTTSLEAAASARTHVLRGAYFAAGNATRRARELAEDAFFQPSFMSLLYLPLEHHLAIYTPFFVPVLLHVFMAVVKEVSRRRRKSGKAER